MFRRFLFSRMWSSAQDHAELMLLLILFNFFISADHYGLFEMFCKKLLQFQRGISGGPALKHFYMIQMAPTIPGIGRGYRDSLLETAQEAVTIANTRKHSRTQQETILWAFVFGSRTEPIWAPSQLSLCTHTPTARSTTISWFPCNWPLIFCQHAIHQVIWQSPGTRVPDSLWETAQEAITVASKCSHTWAQQPWQQRHSLSGFTSFYDCAKLCLESNVPMHSQPRPFELQLFLDFCEIFFSQMAPQFFWLQIRQVIWPSPGTLPGTGYRQNQQLITEGCQGERNRRDSKFFWAFVLVSGLTLFDLSVNCPCVLTPPLF